MNMVGLGIIGDDDYMLEFAYVVDGLLYFGCDKWIFENWMAIFWTEYNVMAIGSHINFL